ncbi:MAG: hypothetical protein ACKVVT_01460 [Dehalococcoidia bacterium]
MSGLRASVRWVVLMLAIGAGVALPQVQNGGERAAAAPVPGKSYVAKINGNAGEVRFDVTADGTKVTNVRIDIDGRGCGRGAGTVGYFHGIEDATIKANQFAYASLEPGTGRLFFLGTFTANGGVAGTTTANLEVATCDIGTRSWSGGIALAVRAVVGQLAAPSLGGRAAVGHCLTQNATFCVEELEITHRGPKTGNFTDWQTTVDVYDVRIRYNWRGDPAVPGTTLTFAFAPTWRGRCLQVNDPVYREVKLENSGEMRFVYSLGRANETCGPGVYVAEDAYIYVDRRPCRSDCKIAAERIVGAFRFVVR